MYRPVDDAEWVALDLGDMFRWDNATWVGYVAWREELCEKHRNDYPTVWDLLNVEGA